MARILLDASTLVGAKLLEITAQIVQLSNNVNRLQSITTAIGTANLESSAESKIPTGQGATIASGITQIKTAVDGLSSLVSVIDRG
jgi:hypothetical protein